MTALGLNLNWFKDSKGYRIVDYGKYGARVVGNGGKLIPFRPLDGNDLVFSAFANVRSPDTLLHFVGLYGLLNAPAYGVKVHTPRGATTTFGSVDFTLSPDNKLSEVKAAPTMYGERVDSHIETAMLFREILQQANKGWRRIPATLADSIAAALDERALGEISLAGDRERGFRVVLTANSLMDGIWLQLGQKVSGQTRFRTCELPTCGELFEVGSIFGRRTDARFCSDAHRIEFNSRRRTKGAQ